MYAGIVGFRLKNFNVDKSISALLHFNETRDSDLLELNNLNKIGEVGIILCDAEAIDDFKKLLAEVKKIKNEEYGENSIEEES